MPTTAAGTNVNAGPAGLALSRFRHHASRCGTSPRDRACLECFAATLPVVEDAACVGFGPVTRSCRRGALGHATEPRPRSSAPGPAARLSVQNGRTLTAELVAGVGQDARGGDLVGLIGEDVTGDGDVVGAEGVGGDRRGEVEQEQRTECWLGVQVAGRRHAECPAAGRHGQRSLRAAMTCWTETAAWPAAAAWSSDLFHHWLDVWSAVHEQAQDDLDSLEVELRRTHSNGDAWVADGLDRIRLGQIDALGPEYAEIYADLAGANAQLASTTDVLNWLSAQAVGYHFPSFEETSSWAAQNTRAAAIYTDFMMTALTAGYGRLGALAEAPETGFAGRISQGSSGAFSRFLRFTAGSSQKGFTKHGTDFGLNGNWNPGQAVAFRRAVNQHINSTGVRVISGTYRGKPVTHYLDPQTGLNVIADPAGNYVSGWRLGPEQLRHVLENGSLN